MQPTEANDDQHLRQDSAVLYAKQADDVFSRNVRARREELGWSQRELAERCEMDPSAVTRIEKGQRTVRIGEAVVLSHVLDVPLSVMVAADRISGFRNAVVMARFHYNQLQGQAAEAAAALAEAEKQLAQAEARAKA